MARLYPLLGFNCRLPLSTCCCHFLTIDPSSIKLAIPVSLGHSHATRPSPRSRHSRPKNEATSGLSEERERERERDDERLSGGFVKIPKSVDFEEIVESLESSRGVRGIAWQGEPVWENTLCFQAITSTVAARVCVCVRTCNHTG